MKFWSLLLSPASSLSRDKADTLLLLATCALLVAPHIAHLPLWVTLVCGSAFSIRTWITLRGHRLPPRWLLLSLVGLAAAGVYLTYQTFIGRETSITILVLLLACKLLETRAKRDIFAITFVGFFLLLTNFLYSQSIGVALSVALSFIVLLTTHISFQYTQTLPPLRQRLRYSVTLCALSLPLTLVLFLFFPRIEGPIWGLSSDLLSGRTGLSDTISPGSIAKLAQSDDIAFRVKFLNGMPPRSALYWRAIVLGNYDGRSWTPLRRLTSVDYPPTLIVRGQPIRQQITLEPHQRRWLFGLELPDAAPQLNDNPTFLTPDSQIVSARLIRQRVRYDIASYTDFDLQADLPPQARQDWLQLPVGNNPRTHEFARRLREQFNNDTQRINAVLQFLRTEKFRYTMEPPPLGLDAVDDFLFTTRAGFCEHYASSFVVLMRALGIPARVVAGYQGGEINPVGDFWTIRQSDAHAWAEVWQEGRGWTRIDPTAAIAPNRIDRAPAGESTQSLLGGLIAIDGGGSWLAALRTNWEALSNSWNQWILDYSLEEQKDLLRAWGFSDIDWVTLIIIMAALLMVALAAIALPMLLNRRKIDAIDALYFALCQRMARHGYGRAAYEGPRAYRLRLTAPTSSLLPKQQNAASNFLIRYENWRYGKPAEKTNKLARLILISQLKSLLAECR